MVLTIESLHTDTNGGQLGDFDALLHDHIEGKNTHTQTQIWYKNKCLNIISLTISKPIEIYVE